MNSSAKQDQLLRLVTDKFLSVGQPEKILLFGSQARGDANPESDFDFLIVEESSKPRYKRAAKYRRVLRKMDFAKDIVVWTPEEIAEWRSVPNAFISTVLREGRIVYEKRT